MAQYCITAANHESKTNHVASVFFVWLRDGGADTWTRLGSNVLIFHWHMLGLCTLLRPSGRSNG